MSYALATVALVLCALSAYGVRGIRLDDAGEAPERVLSLVVGVGLLRAVVEGDERDPVERVVRVRRHLPFRVGLREQVAGGVVAVECENG